LQVDAIDIGRGAPDMALIRAARAPHFCGGMTAHTHTPCLWMDGQLCLCHSVSIMWIRRAHPLQARMPSMRPQPAPAPPARAPAAAVPAQRKPAEARMPAAVPPPPPRGRPSGVDEEHDGGFHESSYELRTGMDIIESEWPEDVTMPGALDEE
jgi:hypothetical protein